VASQEAIKEVGTNGGGFFNANSAHGFENPTPLTNFLQMLEIFLVSAGLTWTFGHMVKKQAHGWALWAAMYIMFFAGTATAYWAEARGNPIHAARGIDVGLRHSPAATWRAGGPFIANSALYATITIDACVAASGMHDRSPHGGMVPLVNRSGG
jgi:K+-transporting ATPase ATPase A chain